MTAFEYINILRTYDKDEILDYDLLHSLLTGAGFKTWDGVISHYYPKIFKKESGIFLSQYPNQFASYLLKIKQLNIPIKSYVEFGVDYGGSLIITTEFLKKFYPLEKIVAVDKIPMKNVLNIYSKTQPITYIQSDTKDAVLEEEYDLGFIDADHSYESAKNDYLILKDRCKLLALHDACNADLPGVIRLWEEIKNQYESYEFFQQYYKDKKYLGIGLIVTGSNRGVKFI